MIRDLIYGVRSCAPSYWSDKGSLPGKSRASLSHAQVASRCPVHSECNFIDLLASVPVAPFLGSSFVQPPLTSPQRAWVSYEVSSNSGPAEQMDTDGDLLST